VTNPLAATAAAHVAVAIFRLICIMLLNSRHPRRLDI
jgi:hypothetical protein